VTLAEQADDRQFDGFPLADDHPFYVVYHTSSERLDVGHGRLLMGKMG